MRLSTHRAPAARAVIALALCVVGCGSSEEASPPARERGPFAEAPPTLSAPPPADPSSSRGRRSRESERFGSGSLEATGTTSATTTTTTTTTIEVPGEHERDLGADLASAIGSPASCIDVETARALHGHLAIRVTATVMATGSITRASASASGLSPAAIACVEDRALHAHLTPPIERAPRGVSTTLEYDVAATADTRTTTTPEIPTPRGAVAPGIVTPAIGPDGPVQGSVAPSSTLPALGPSGRPEGSVAPDLVLPARTP